MQNVYPLVGLVHLEIERNRLCIKKTRLKRQRGQMSIERPLCPICLEFLMPSREVVYPECGHLSCMDCMVKIFDDPHLNDACGVCRKVIPDLLDLEKVFFKFNYDGETICRFCDKPFRGDVGEEDSCHVLRCLHAYHKRCLQYTNLVCIACIQTVRGARDSKRVFLHFD